MPQDFDWYADDNKPDIIFPSVQATAVYLNKDLDVVIRQQHHMGDEDSVIIIPRSQAKAVAKAIMDAAKPLPNIKGGDL